MCIDNRGHAPPWYAVEGAGSGTTGFVLTATRFLTLCVRPQILRCHILSLAPGCYWRPDKDSVVVYFKGAPVPLRLGSGCAAVRRPLSTRGTLWRTRRACTAAAYIAAGPCPAGCVRGRGAACVASLSLLGSAMIWVALWDLMHDEQRMSGEYEHVIAKPGVGTHAGTRCQHDGIATTVPSWPPLRSCDEAQPAQPACADSSDTAGASRPLAPDPCCAVVPFAAVVSRFPTKSLHCGRDDHDDSYGHILCRSRPGLAAESSRGRHPRVDAVVAAWLRVGLQEAVG